MLLTVYIVFLCIGILKFASGMTSEATPRETTQDEETTTQQYENASIAFYLVPENVSQLQEMYVGMRANVSLIAELPPGVYNQTTITLGDERVGNIDIGSIQCVQGKSVASQNGIRANKTFYDRSFRRDSLLGYRYFTLTVSGDSHSTEDRQVICNFVIYLHNANGLTNEQKIHLKARMEVTTATQNLKFEKNLSIVARTSLLIKNKVDRCEIDSTSKIGEKGKAVRIPVSCWLPSYQPGLQIIVKDGSVPANMQNIFSIYVMMLKYGDNFIPGADTQTVPASSRFIELSPGYMIFVLSSYWVNREYLYTEITTDKDLLKFDIGVALSESISPGGNYTINVEIYYHGTKQKEASVNVTAAEPPSSAGVIGISLYSNETNELVPSNQLSLFVQLTLPTGYTGSIPLDVYTQSQTVLEKSAIIIKNVSIYEKSSMILCEMSPLSIKTTDFTTENVTRFTVYFTNVDEQSAGLITLLMTCEIDSKHGKFGAQYDVFVKSHTLSKYTVRLNQPDILQDTSGRLSSQLYQVLDGNITTCMDLPNNGEIPPFFWLKMKTEWLHINMTSYDITLAGNGFTCKRHEGRSIQISYSTDRTCPNFGCLQQVKFCNLIPSKSSSDGLWQECVFHCDCSREECQNVNIVMTNTDQVKWSLCELSAKQKH